MVSRKTAGGCNMKILCLYNNECALELFQWVKEQGHETVLETERLNACWCVKNRFDLAMSYTYPYIIQSDVINALNNNIVNIHNSFLPYNRGSYPNIWSILDGTPRGVTLHYINSGLDKGDIISQKIVPLEKSATLRSSYEQLDMEAKKMFQEAFLYYSCWNELRKKCLGKGTYHTDKDFFLLKRYFERWDWNVGVQEFLEEIRYYKHKDL